MIEMLSQSPPAMGTWWFNEEAMTQVLFQPLHGTDEPMGIVDTSLRHGSSVEPRAVDSARSPKGRHEQHTAG